MSGGAFHYLDEQIGEEMRGRWEDAEIDELFADMFCNGEFSARDYGGLALALDFYLEGDTEEADYRDCVSRFKRKWMRRTPKDRAEFYQRKIQEAADRYKREMGEA